MKKFMLAALAAVFLSACGLAELFDEINNAIEGASKRADAVMALDGVLPTLTGKVLETIASEEDTAEFTDNGTIKISGAVTNPTAIAVKFDNFSTNHAGKVSGSLRLTGTVNLPEDDAAELDPKTLTAEFTANVKLTTESDTHEFKVELKITDDGYVAYEGTAYEEEINGKRKIKWSDEEEEDFDPNNIITANSCAIELAKTCTDYAVVTSCDAGETDSTHSCKAVFHDSTATAYCVVDAGQVVSYFGDDNDESDLDCIGRGGDFHVAP